MNTAPTYAPLLNSTSSSEEELSIPGKPPSNQTVVGSALDHGGLKYPAATHTPMEATNEDVFKYSGVTLGRVPTLIGYA